MRSHATGRRAAGVLFAGMCLWALASAGGCATQPEPIELPHAAGDYNPPIVISGRPERDALALEAAEEHLSEAD